MATSGDGVPNLRAAGNHATCLDSLQIPLCGSTCGVTVHGSGHHEPWIRNTQSSYGTSRSCPSQPRWESPSCPGGVVPRVYGENEQSYEPPVMGPVPSLVDKGAAGMGGTPQADPTHRRNFPACACTTGHETPHSAPTPQSGSLPTQAPPPPPKKKLYVPARKQKQNFENAEALAAQYETTIQTYQEQEWDIIYPDGSSEKHPEVGLGGGGGCVVWQPTRYGGVYRPRGGSNQQPKGIKVGPPKSAGTLGGTSP